MIGFKDKIVINDHFYHEKTTMEKRLLLLGILLSHDVHGYELAELFKHSVGIPIEIKKPNAYRLLGALEKDGLITHTEEQVGNRPTRRVYSITEAGKKEFMRLLRANIATYAEPEFPAMVGIDFASFLPAEEAVELLKTRLARVTEKAQAFDAIPAEIFEAHPTTAYLKDFYSQEVNWLKEFIVRLENK